jgi:phage gp45-like
MTYKSPHELANQGWPLERFVRGMIRRMAVTLTTGVLWQVRGYKGGANATGGDETPNYEPFTGIGFYSTPPSSGKPEAIVTHYGSTKTGAIVALRDEATRKVGAGDLAQGETCVYNDQARVIVKANGAVEIRLHGGVAVALATYADVKAVRDALDGHAHTYLPGTGTAALTTLNPAVPAPVGTSVLKAQ